MTTKGGTIEWVSEFVDSKNIIKSTSVLKKKKTNVSAIIIDRNIEVIIYYYYY